MVKRKASRNRKQTDILLPHILLLDDNKKSIKRYQALLRNKLVGPSNYIIKGFTTGSGLLRWLKKNIDSRQVALVLSDFKLYPDDGPIPRRFDGFSGLEVLLQVRTLSPKTKCVLYSAFAERSHLEEAFNSDIIDAFFNLTGMFFRNQFYYTINNLLNKWKGECAYLKKECFVIMPFGGDFDRIYKKLFNPAIKALGYRCIRQDECHPMSKLIINEILQNIARSFFIVADISEPNPNVFYELGVAHSMSKPVILFSQSVSSTPFDVRGFHVSKYNAKERSFQKIKKEISKALQELQGPE